MAEAKSPYKIFMEMLRHPSAKTLVGASANFVAKFPADLSRDDAADKIHKFISKAEDLMFTDIVVFMADCDEQGRTNAVEGFEKMIIGRLFPKVFEIDPVDAIEDAKLKTHIDGLSWVTFEHLGIPSVEISLWPRVLQELRSMDDYKAPFDKLTCIVNACHVINDVLKRTQAELGASRPLSADDFLPLLILAVIKANPPRLQSNVEFVAAFRHPSRLNGEYAYWITMLMSAKEFVRQAGPSTLDVSAEDYARFYEASLRAAECGGPAPETQAAPVPTAVETRIGEPQMAIGPAHVPEQVHEEALEKVLLEQTEVMVYQIPAISPEGHKAGEWQSVIWTGPCTVASKGRDLAIRMIDKANGRLFAECLVPVNEYHNYVEPVSDSVQHFALKITNGQKQALIGLGFADKTHALELQSILQDFRNGWDVPGTSIEANVACDKPELDLMSLTASSSQPTPSARPEIGQQEEACHPAVGHLVEIINEDAPRVTGTIGMRGTVTESDDSDMPYKVSLAYGDQCWYKEAWVRVVSNGNALALPASPKASSSTLSSTTASTTSTASRSSDSLSSQSSDPFAEFVDMMSSSQRSDPFASFPPVEVHALHNTRIPVMA